MIIVVIILLLAVLVAINKWYTPITPYLQLKRKKKKTVSWHPQVVTQKIIYYI